MNKHKQQESIAAIILASGLSKRMGSPKQLLLYHDKPLLEYMIRKLLPLPFNKIYAVVGHKSNEIMNKISVNDSRFEWKINRNYKDGQSAALKCAIKCVNDCKGVMVFLADQPLIKRETIKKVFDYAAEQIERGQEGFVVQPSYLGRNGHPVFFSKMIYPSFDSLRGDEGGKSIIKEASHHYLLNVEDQGILLDIDTQEDYRCLLENEFCLFSMQNR